MFTLTPYEETLEVEILGSDFLVKVEFTCFWEPEELPNYAEAICYEIHKLTLKGVDISCLLPDCEEEIITLLEEKRLKFKED